MRASTERAFHRILASALGALAAVATSSLAAPPTWPTPEDIVRAQREHPFPSREQLDAQPIKPLPRLAPTPVPIDLYALAKRHPAEPLALSTSASPVLRVFVTLAMPQASLASLVDQAERTHAMLVLRGLKEQSLRHTIAAVQNLVGTRPVAWTIDPEAFTRYGVTLAPTVVLDLGTGTTPGCTSACSDRLNFLAVSGDVSLDYALEALRRERPEHAARIDPFLARLRTR